MQDAAQTVACSTVSARPLRAAIRTAASSGAPAGEVDQPSEDAIAVGAQGVVLVLAGHPRARAADEPGGLLGEGPLDVWIVGVDRRRDRDLVGPQALGVVEARPLVRGEQVGRL